MLRFSDLMREEQRRYPLRSDAWPLLPTPIRQHQEIAALCVAPLDEQIHHLTVRLAKIVQKVQELKQRQAEELIGCSSAERAALRQMHLEAQAPFWLEYDEFLGLRDGWQAVMDELVKRAGDELLTKEQMTELANRYAEWLADALAKQEAARPSCDWCGRRSTEAFCSPECKANAAELDAALQEEAYV